MTAPASWAPILDGELRGRAIGECRRIVEALAGQPALEEWFPRESAECDASLGSGVAGVALSLGALAEYGVAPDAREKALELLELSTRAMASEEMNASLHDGYPGIAWVFSRLSMVHASPVEDELSEVDAALADALSETPWTGDYDLISGLVGTGIYALERLPRPAARACIERIVDRLEETAEIRGDAVTWFTQPGLLTEWQLRTTPDGFYNLGLAHGVPGVVGLLGQFCAAGVAVRRSRDLLDGAVKWLLGSRPPADRPFPYWTGPGIDPAPTRLAWCYGDPGVAAALFVAARCAREPVWERQALEIALRSAARPPQDAGVVDAGLCHGAAGLAHIYNRIYQRTKNEAIRSAAVSWIERTLDMSQRGSGLAGYTTARKNLEGVVIRESDPSFLTGVAGIALALAAASTPIEPEWDRSLMLSSLFE